MKKTFPTPQDAENAFYEALERADFEAMMAVWAEDEEIVCVHPGGPRLAGLAQVRASWQQMFASGQRLRVRIVDPVVLTGMAFSIHSVHEFISVAGETGAPAAVIATNVYARSPAGWRMVEHHGSIAPAPQRRANEKPSDKPKILH